MPRIAYITKRFDWKVWDENAAREERERGLIQRASSDSDKVVAFLDGDN